MKHWLSALKAFFQHYAYVFKQVWHIRDQLDPPNRSKDELAFLPAHLELVETPVSPVPRWSMRAIILFAAIALLWAIFGHMDIVAVATGKTVTGGRTKVIQPLEPAVVDAIYVKDGQHVKEGQLLVKLDTTSANAEYQKAKEALITSQLTFARFSALLDAIEANKTPKLSSIEGVPEEQLYAEDTITVGQYHAYITRVETQKSLINQKEAELHTVQQQIQKLANTSKMVATQASDYKKLYDENFISKHAWMQKEQERVEQQSDLAAQRSRLNELQAALKSQQQELAAITAEFKRDALEKQKQAQDNITQYKQEAKKTKQREEIMTLKAPVSGMVQQLAIHTVGGVVTEAQPLMAIVPDDETIEIEAMIENKDIGFVKNGQEAVVKIESFPYTRYGFIEGIVESVSHDAVQDEQRGLIFPVRVRLSQNFLMIDGVKVNLTSGMSVSAEIKTGKRRVIDYFLSPLREYSEESLRER
ncbi:HlyD family type I secretion periplasmic adaptor subunit [Neisseria sp. Ec49-e6-T10]|uniref:HlyD family type I secretion periplasmic adaptor subunit n=1 Tax=Neisseria sp. Ec49-e6-T10 TaxID=3140744 RepID=UPI003EBF8630